MGKKVATISPPPSVLVSLAKAFDSLEQEVDKREEELKALKKRMHAAEYKLVDEMTTQQVTNFRTTSIGGFRQQVCVYPNIKDREVFAAWIKKHKFKFLYTVSLNGNKVKSFVRERMENKKSVPPGVDPFLKTEIRRFK